MLTTSIETIPASEELDGYNVYHFYLKDDIAILPIDIDLEESLLKVK